MYIEYWWYVTERGRLRYSEINQCKFHFVRHKSHMECPGLNPSLRGQTPTTICKPLKLFPFPLQSEYLHQLTPSSGNTNLFTYTKFVSRYTNSMFSPIDTAHIQSHQLPFLWFSEKKNSTHESILNHLLSCRPACNPVDRLILWLWSSILPHAIITLHKI